MKWDTLWVNGMLATCEQGYGLIEQGAIAVKDGKIAWVGSIKDLPAAPESLAKDIYDFESMTVFSQRLAA